MRIRDFENGDEEAIAALYETRDARRRVQDGFRWRHVEAPGAFSSPLIRIAEHDDRVVGFAAATRQDLVIDGTNHPAAQLGLGALGRSTGDVDVDTELLESVTERARGAGMAYVYFAAGEKQQPLLEQLGHTFLFEVSARNLYIGLEALSSRLSKRALSPFRKFAKEARRIRTKLTTLPLDDAAFDQVGRLYSNTEVPTAFGIAKSPEYLAWRYRDDPRFDYELLVYKKRAGQGIDAAAFVRRARGETGRTVIHVEEQWTRQTGRRSNAKLFGELAMLGLTEESDVLRCFAPANTSREQALLGLGCIRKKVERVFMVRRLDTEAPELPTPFVAKDLQVSSGDLELYDP